MSDFDKDSFLNKSYNNFSLRCYKLDQERYNEYDIYEKLTEENKRLNNRLK